MGGCESVEWDGDDEEHLVPPQRVHCCEEEQSDSEDDSQQRRTQGCCDDESESEYDQRNNFVPPTRQATNNYAPIRSINDPSVVLHQPTFNNNPQVVINHQPTIVHRIPTICDLPNETSPQPPLPIVSPTRCVLDIHELLAETENIEAESAKTIVQLFEKQNTIPFICRYRRDLIGNIQPDKLYTIKNAYHEIICLRKRAETIIGELEKVVEVNDNIRAHILSAKSIKELEHRHAIYKPANTDDPQVLYLKIHEQYAKFLLKGVTQRVSLEDLVDYSDPRFNTLQKLKDIICHIVSEELSRHTGVGEELRRLQNVHKIVLKCSKAEIVHPKATEPVSSTSTEATTPTVENRNDQLKYEKYFKFENDVRYVRPHQVLAINRGERFKFLTVHLIIPEEFKNNIRNYINGLFKCNCLQLTLRDEIITNAFEKCYNTKLLPLVRRQVHADLTEKGKKAAILGFATNLKQLLLMPPLKGEPILGIDPGFTNGCKCAVISETGDVLEVGVVHPHIESNDSEKCGVTLANMLTTHGCKRIALGNGTACRETEAWLAKLFDKGILDRTTVRYDIISEQGASVYSCSAVARKELPDLDVTLISAVSIARRLNDPLSEYVKIDPRHLGIGMYQHDISQKFLLKCLNEVVSECVSFVGLDINTASVSLLKHVAGLDEKRAQNIIQYRQSNGPFRTRKDLLKVRGIGKKSYVQCAGFIRIEPKTVGGKIDNLLDCTWVHPESYTIATKIIRLCDLKVNDIGKPEFISTIRTFAQSSPIESLATRFNTPTERLQIVLEALLRELFQDYRSDKINQKQPLFKKDITRITDLFIGEIVTGEVRNIVDFGAFIDIGLECDALIHKTKMNGIKLNLGDRVSTSVLDIDIPQKHIELRLDELIK